MKIPNLTNVDTNTLLNELARRTNVKVQKSAAQIKEEINELNLKRMRDSAEFKGLVKEYENLTFKPFTYQYKDIFKFEVGFHIEYKFKIEEDYDSIIFNWLDQTVEAFGFDADHSAVESVIDELDRKNLPKTCIDSYKKHLKNLNVPVTKLKDKIKKLFKQFKVESKDWENTFCESF